MNNPRLTGNVLRVLSVVASSAEADGLAGSDIGRNTGLASGTLYPILTRLEAADWLVSQWEPGDPSVLGRPRKRFYRITGIGSDQLASDIANDMRGLAYP